MSREAIEEAIEVLEDASAEMLMETGDKNYYVEAIAVLRQALVDADDTSQERVDEIVKDEHEPVAWANSFDLQNFDMKVRTGPDLHHTVPLYTAPPKRDLTCVCGAVWEGEMMVHPPRKREWISLTDEEIDYQAKKDDHAVYFALGALWAEAKLKEKNT